MKVLVGLSGGVDSAVAVYILKEQGYVVVGGFMKNYVDEENPNCTTYNDAKEAIKVADFLGIELLSFDFQKEYEKRIIKYIYDGYKNGITPNPDMLCNNLIKFDLFLDSALDLGFNKIATGHYARIESYLSGRMNGGFNYSRNLPYDPKLKERARELRKKETKAEKKISIECLSKLDYRFYKQRPIDRYIVDFYCSKLNLVIEIDGNTHWSDKEIAYDINRSKILVGYGLNILRFTNKEVLENIEGVYIRLLEYINKPPLTPPNRRGINEPPLDYTKLLRGVDYNKDQSYFLSGLNQYQLSKSIFPLGDLTKGEVRKIAKKIGLPNSDRKDSQGLCFVGNISMREFLKKRLAVKKGDIVLLNGEKVGEHDGAYFFTIGQSRGLDINKKAYVVKIDVKKNLIYVSYDKQEHDLLKKEIIIKCWHWIGEKYDLPLKCSAKIRYRQEPSQGTVYLSGQAIKSEKGKIKFIFAEEQWGVAPGQSLVAYLGDECIGGGVIQ